MILTVIIILVTIIISLMAFPPNVQSIPFLHKPELFGRLAFRPYLIWHQKQWWRLITAGFVHINLWHLIVNMFVLYFFGRTVEFNFLKYFGLSGWPLYLIFYLLAIVVANLPDLIRFKDNYYYIAAGASGAVSAIVFASILFEPWAKLIIFPIPIPIPAIVFAVLYLIYEYAMGRYGSDKTAHYVHFWGAIFGFVFPIILKPEILLDFLEQFG